MHAHTNQDQDQLQPWEKWPIWLLMGANGVMIFHWFAKPYLNEWWDWLLSLLYVAGGFAAAVAIDGAMVATTMGRRAGRNGFWSHVAAIVATAFGASVALDLHGAWDVGAWIHAGFALLIFTYLQHLAQIRRTLEQASHSAEQRPYDLEQTPITVGQFTFTVRELAVLVEQKPSTLYGRLQRRRMLLEQTANSPTDAELLEPGDRAP